MITWMTVIKRIRVGFVILGCLPFNQLRYSADDTEDEKLPETHVSNLMKQIIQGLLIFRNKSLLTW